MRHWIFDLDGTLVDTLETYFEKLRRVFQHFDVTYTDADLHRARDYFDAREFFSLYLDQRRTGEAVDLLTTLNLKLAYDAKAFQGIEDTLKELKSYNVHLSIFTGRDLDSTTIILEKTGLKPFFSSVVSGSCVSSKKPHPEGIQKLFAKTGFDCKSSLMVGDHPCDMQAAQAAGVKGVSVDWNGSSHYSFDSLSHFHFSQITDFKNWVRDMLSSS